MLTRTTPHLALSHSGCGRQSTEEVNDYRIGDNLIRVNPISESGENENRIAQNHKVRMQSNSAKRRPSLRAVGSFKRKADMTEFCGEAHPSLREVAP